VELGEERPRERRSTALIGAEMRRIGGGGGLAGAMWRGEVGARRSVQRRQRPGHAGHERAGMAAQNRESGTLMCGPHGTVPVGQVKWRSINLN
jgi:hypothetical protein